ncbi:mannose-1-phosphate guanylyltransferase/mannose-6-phosphate isomerase [Paenochrobactrum sp. BZR 588]|uniref:mannose-1-phosphate guanylyltransferase/mannose-6-phosphate isomerase n=1 Tax=unclassified Paenochrobactrum TaxID=2639760 RepID=UPI003854AB70
MNFVPVIISGGVGSRLWPLSRDAHPKPFIDLPQGGTLIGRTYERAAALKDVKDIITVTNRDFLFLTLDAYADFQTNDNCDIFLLEPQGRDTAAAVALAALHAHATFGGDTILLILPSDHLVQDQDAFSKGVERAKELASTGRIVTFGIVPESPETGFGYLEAEHEDVLRFVEKPDEDTARSYVESGRYFWNSGMFCFQADAMIAAMREHCPEVLQGAEAALEKARSGQQGNAETFEIDKDLFAATPAISIDYAVMEKQANIACIPLDCGWSDIGSWSAMAELVEPDEDGNRVNGEALLENTHGSFVYSEDRLVSLIGVDDLLVVDTADALLVTHKDNAQQVRNVYNRLKKQNHEAAQLHRTAHRPWGSYTILEEGDNFKIKRIVVKPGRRLSLQSHHHRSEHWIVVSGTAKVTNGDDVILLTTNQSTYIPCGHKHRLENPGILPLVLIEVQSGEYLGEDDIVRFDDMYGRS